MASFTNPFSMKGLSELLGKLHQKSPTSYNVIGAAVAITGVTLLALVPLMAVIAPLSISSAFSASWLSGLIWIAISAVSIVALFSLIRSKIAIPSGLGIKQDKAPKLHELVDEMGLSYDYTKISKIVIHDHYGIDIVQVPKFGLPLLNTTVLHIGLPVLQSLSPMEFKGALSRKIGQYSARHNKLTHWIYRWRQFCAQYQKSYKKQNDWYYMPIKLFFNIYTPVLNLFTVHIARKDELEADTYALEMVNDEELADIIVRYHVCQQFMTMKYWPKVHSMYRKNPEGFTTLPHISMQKVMKSALNENEFAQSLKDLMSTDATWYATSPSLHERLEHLGQSKLNLPPPVMETAAYRFLGDAYSAVIKLMDKQWLAKQPTKSAKVQFDDDVIPPSAPKQEAKPTKAKPAAKKVEVKHEQAPDADNYVVEDSFIDAGTLDEPSDSGSEENRYAALKTKCAKNNLSDHEAYDLATLAETYETKKGAVAVYQKILKQKPRHGQTMFAVGRILLAENDAAGVKVLERAMELDKGCIAQSCWMLAKYYKAQGDDSKSRKYLEKAANVSAAA